MYRLSFIPFLFQSYLNLWIFDNQEMADSAEAPATSEEPLTNGVEEEEAAPQTPTQNGLPNGRKSESPPAIKLPEETEPRSALTSG